VVQLTAVDGTSGKWVHLGSASPGNPALKSDDRCCGSCNTEMPGSMKSCRGQAYWVEQFLLMEPTGKTSMISKPATQAPGSLSAETRLGKKLNHRFLIDCSSWRHCRSITGSHWGLSSAWAASLTWPEHTRSFLFEREPVLERDPAQQLQMNRQADKKLRQELRNRGRLPKAVTNLSAQHPPKDPS